MKRVVSFFTRLCEAYLPDAFVFCLLLTLIVFVGAFFFTPHSALELVNFWGKDFWSLHTFAMQMIFVLITGHMLATTPLVNKTIARLIQKVSTETQGLIVISLFSIAACWINWGFGLIVSAVLAIELAKKLGKVNVGLFLATAYSGFLVWHGGLSGSIPLKIAGNDEILSKVFPSLSIPLSETVFSTFNLILVSILVVVLPLAALLMRDGHQSEIQETSEEINLSPKLSPRYLERSPLLNIIFFVLFLVIMIQDFMKGASLDINRVNLIFLFLALLLHGTPMRFLHALKNAFGLASGIAIQFPFYAGIMGLMQYSGLADHLSSFFVQISSSTTLPLFAFLSGGIVNFFVPSGGGQWVVQGPIMLKAAHNLGVDPAKVSMAIAWGDAWTNMIQPFWALPLLAMARLELKDIMGYCLVYLITSGLIISAFFLWF